MAVVTKKSTYITNFEAAGTGISSKSDLGVGAGRARHFAATFEVAAGDDDGSTFQICALNSNMILRHCWVFNDAITGGTGYDLGLYTTGGVAVDDDVYASAVTMASARTTAPIDLAFEARDIANIENKIWQDAGQSSDPVTQYYLVLTADTVGTAAGTISVDAVVLVD